MRININKKDKHKMKQIISLTALRNGAKRIPMGLGCALALTFPHLNATAQDVNLGTANNYAVLAGSAITSTGPTVLNGGLGLTPGSSVTGGPIVNGLYDVDNAAALQAQNDLTTAYNHAAGLARTQTLTGLDLGNRTLTPGVYFFADSAELTGQLTLDGRGLADPVFVFQIGSTLTTASGSSVVTINDDGSATPGISVFWQIGSSATLGTSTAFEGNILALTSITLDTGATDLDGRVLARNGAVTLDDNTITAPPAEPQTSGGDPVTGGGVPDTGSTLLLLGAGLAALFAFGRRFSVLVR
jgi:hypothetical protein